MCRRKLSAVTLNSSTSSSRSPFALRTIGRKSRAGSPWGERAEVVLAERSQRFVRCASRTTGAATRGSGAARGRSCDYGSRRGRRRSAPSPRESGAGNPLRPPPARDRGDVPGEDADSGPPAPSLRRRPVEPVKLATWPSACTPASVRPATPSPSSREDLVERVAELAFHGSLLRLGRPAREIRSVVFECELDNRHGKFMLTVSYGLRRCHRGARRSYAANRLRTAPRRAPAGRRARAGPACLPPSGLAAPPRAQGSRARPRPREGTRNYYSVDSDALAELREYFESFWEDALAAFKEAAEKGESDDAGDE